MSDSSSNPPGADAARVRELLPWFASDALEGEPQAFVEAWLARQAEVPADIAAELAWWRSASRVARDDAAARALSPAAALAADEGLAQLMARVASVREQEGVEAARAPAARAAARPGVLQRLQQALSGAFASRSPAMAWGLATLAVAQGVAIAVLLLREPAQQVPLSGGTDSAGNAASAGQALFTVAFKPQASQQAVQQLLADAGAQIVAGPSALGLFRVAVPAAGAAQAQAAFSAATGVVESVQRER
jgi:hypothetical protein